MDGPSSPQVRPPREGDNPTGRSYGEIIAVGVRPAGGGPIALQEPPRPGEPTLRWASRARSIPQIEAELARIWAVPNLMATVEGEAGRHIAARTSVMNLVVVARRPEVGERCAATINQLTGRHPSRTLIVLSADPDGPSWIDGRVEAPLPGIELRQAFGRRRRTLVRDVVGHARERVDRGDVGTHRRRQQPRRHGKILVMRPRQRLACRVRAREHLGPVGHWGILVRYA